MTPENNAFQLVLQGDETYKKGNYPEAERLYLKAIEIAGRNEEETSYIYSSLVVHPTSFEQYFCRGEPPARPYRNTIHHLVDEHLADRQSPCQDIA